MSYFTGETETKANTVVTTSISVLKTWPACQDDVRRSLQLWFMFGRWGEGDVYALRVLRW